MVNAKQGNEYRVNMKTKRTRYPYVWVSARQTKMSRGFLPTVVDTVSEVDHRSVPVVDTVSEVEHRSVPVVDTVPKVEHRSVTVVDTAIEVEHRSVTVVNTSTTGVRYPHVRVSTGGMEIAESLPTGIDTEDSVPVVNVATEGVRYPMIWKSAAGTKMPEHLSPVLVTVRKGVRSVWSPELDKAKENIEILPVNQKNNVTEEANDKKETLDFIQYVVTNLNMLNLRLLDLKVIKLNITSTSLLEEVTDLIVQQALIRTKFVSQYAKLCASMANDKNFNTTPRDSDKTFKDVLKQNLMQLCKNLTERRTMSIDKNKLSSFTIFINELHREGALSAGVAEQIISVCARSSVSSMQSRNFLGSRSFPKRSA